MIGTPLLNKLVSQKYTVTHFIIISGLIHASFVHILKALEKWKITALILLIFQKLLAALIMIRGEGGSYFLYFLLNEIQTMFSQLAKRSARVDLCADHFYYVKNHR